MNSTDILNADSDNFWLDWYPTFWLLNAEVPLQLYLFWILNILENTCSLKLTHEPAPNTFFIKENLLDLVYLTGLRGSCAVD